MRSSKSASWPMGMKGMSAAWAAFLKRLAVMRRGS
jgi:hypothetical protein